MRKTGILLYVGAAILVIALVYAVILALTPPITSDMDWKLLSDHCLQSVIDDPSICAHATETAQASRSDWWAWGH